MGPSGEHIATPSSCLYNWLLKTKIGSLVAKLKRDSNLRGVRLLAIKLGSLACSAQIFTVSIKEMFVNKASHEKKYYEKT